MSDDLIARLTGSHDDGCEVFLTMMNHRPTCSCSFLDRIEAAKEIERLRAELKRIIDSDDTSSGRQREALRARAERAEARVEQLTAERDGWMKAHRHLMDPIVQAKMLAPAPPMLAPSSAAVEVLMRERDALRALLAEARKAVESWTPDEANATHHELDELNRWYELRDRIDAALRERS